MLELQGGINEWTITSVQIGKQNKWALNQFIRKKKGKKIFTGRGEISLYYVQKWLKSHVSFQQYHNGF